MRETCESPILTAVLSHVIRAVMTTESLRSHSHLTHLLVMMLSLGLSDHHGVVMFVLRWVLKCVRSADDGRAEN